MSRVERVQELLDELRYGPDDIRSSVGCIALEAAADLDNPDTSRALREHARWALEMALSSLTEMTNPNQSPGVLDELRARRLARRWTMFRPES